MNVAPDSSGLLRSRNCDHGTAQPSHHLPASMTISPQTTPCEQSEAIQSCKLGLDCFVAYALRNDDRGD
jgi:hypothetical protein